MKYEITFRFDAETHEEALEVWRGVRFAVRTDGTGVASGGLPRRGIYGRMNKRGAGLTLSELTLPVVELIDD